MPRVGPGQSSLGYVSGKDAALQTGRYPVILVWRVHLISNGSTDIAAGSSRSEAVLPHHAIGLSWIVAAWSVTKIGVASVHVFE